MSDEIELIEITKGNMDEFKPSCFVREDDPANAAKKEWVKKRIKEGLKIKVLYQGKRWIGMIEYVPGENAWRAVDAKGYMFIQCIWTNPKKIQKKGFGTMLIKEAEKDAKSMNGVAVVVSDGPFMATKEIFVKNGYKEIEQSGDYSLLVKQNKKGKLPSFNDWEKELKKYNKGIHIVYSDQCPWVTKFIYDVDLILKKHKLKATIKKLNSPKQAQKSPSIYGTFNLIYNGKLLVDHYISARRFENIIKKELK